MRTVLQVPLSIDLRKEAEKQALAQGFSSLQEAVRVFLKKLSLGAMGVTFEGEKAERLSPKAERRYEKMLQDIKSGKEKVYKANSVKDLMLQLNS